MLDVSERNGQRGYSHTEFNLRMTREDMGSYPGMTLETVTFVARGPCRAAYLRTGPTGRQARTVSTSNRSCASFDILRPWWGTRLRQLQSARLRGGYRAS